MTPHGAIIGATGSGKTHCAQQSAADFRAHGIGVLALHKPMEPWPAACIDWQTDDPEKFLWKFDRSRQCACFMELADTLVDKWDVRFHRCFTQGRHLGHRCFYVSQRAATIHPAIRDNCGRLYLFATNAAGARLWASEFNDAALLWASQLKPREFFFKPDRYTPAQLLTLTR